jgi:hypothetical protein
MKAPPSLTPEALIVQPPGRVARRGREEWVERVPEGLRSDDGGVPEGVSDVAADLISRRSLLTRAGILGGVAVLGQIPLLLRDQGLLEVARAQGPAGVQEALNGFVAFVVPGPDPYSVAQGQSSKTPGGIAAGATEALIELLDHYVPVTPGLDLPASGGVATLLDQTALQVNPVATGGGFTSPFARLSFAEKVEVMRRLEELTESQKDGPGGELRFVSGILAGATAFLAFGEAGVIDPRTRQLTRRPVGWDLTNYDGIAEGRAELKGYWQGRRRVRTDRRFRTPAKKRSKKR